MTDEQFERLIAALELIAHRLDLIEDRMLEYNDLITDLTYNDGSDEIPRRFLRVDASR